MNLYLLKNFNNYYNRKLKFYNDIGSYLDYAIDSDTIKQLTGEE